MSDDEARAALILMLDKSGLLTMQGAMSDEAKTIAEIETRIAVRSMSAGRNHGHMSEMDAVEAHKDCTALLAIVKRQQEESDAWQKCAMEACGERNTLRAKWGIETDESLTECVERNIDGWKERALKAEGEEANLTDDISRALETIAAENEARVTAEKREAALRTKLIEIVNWAVRHGKEPDWLDDAQALAGGPA